MTKAQVMREVDQIADVGGNSNTTQVMCLCALAIVHAILSGCSEIAGAIEEKGRST